LQFKFPQTGRQRTRQHYQVVSNANRVASHSSLYPDRVATGNSQLGGANLECQYLLPFPANNVYRTIVSGVFVHKNQFVRWLRFSVYTDSTYRTVTTYYYVTTAVDSTGSESAFLE